jgi:tetratricopeptide (TPR) repeat protein
MSMGTTQQEIPWIALMSFQDEWDWVKSETAFKKAISLEPGHVLAHAYYSHLLLILKRFDAAVSEAEKALELDPKNPLVLTLCSVVFWQIGEIEKALDLAQRSQEINPNNGILYTILEGTSFLKGDFKSSMDFLERKHGNRVDNFEIVEKEYREHGYESAMIILAGLLKEQAIVPSLVIARYYYRAGRLEEAVIWLEHAYKSHDSNLPYAFLPYSYENLRSDQRYADIAKRMNLPF